MLVYFYTVLLFFPDPSSMFGKGSLNTSLFCGVEVPPTMATNFQSLYHSVIRHYVGSGGGNTKHGSESRLVNQLIDAVPLCM
jgi:hypothetical protein